MFSIFQSFLNGLFPPVCLHCQREGVWLCDQGQAALNTIEPLINPLLIDGVTTVICRGSYDHPLLAKLITGIKYNGWTAYQAILSDVVAVLVSQPSWPPDAVIIPVPLHSRRRRWRGFNQAELIAIALAEATATPVSTILRRSRATRTQAQLSAANRVTNVQGSFQLARGVTAVPACGILIDDVITTGSTIRECAAVLRQHGMKKIIAVALAKG